MSCKLRRGLLGFNPFHSQFIEDFGQTSYQVNFG